MPSPSTPAKTLPRYRSARQAALLGRAWRGCDHWRIAAMARNRGRARRPGNTDDEDLVDELDQSLRSADVASGTNGSTETRETGERTCQVRSKLGDGIQERGLALATAAVDPRLQVSEHLRARGYFRLCEIFAWTLDICRKQMEREVGLGARWHRRRTVGSVMRASPPRASLKSPLVNSPLVRQIHWQRRRATVSELSLILRVSLPATILLVPAEEEKVTPSAHCTPGYTQIWIGRQTLPGSASRMGAQAISKSIPGVIRVSSGVGGEVRIGIATKRWVYERVERKYGKILKSLQSDGTWACSCKQTEPCGE
ncbi:hypothetical protein FB451DRAFT_1491882 [Mycena latifolia]|nr:hypothetical protein FB451DRAFT_1491882 [Mycena latifolia]